MRNIRKLLAELTRKLVAELSRRVFVFVFVPKVLVFVLVFVQVQVAYGDNLPAFPSAEGYGMYTTGGRGGKVYHVTTLSDSVGADKTPGTLRYAIRQKGPRTVVFDVSGTIFLTKTLQIRNKDITIAGQTAPGDGICIADFPFQLQADNIIIRFVRFRPGNRFVAQHEADGLEGRGLHNVIIDHCSVSWSIDECLSVYGSWNTTVQWCLVAESMNNCGHSKGAHGFGGNWGGSGASYHHNLLCHHKSRAPRLGPSPGTQCDERIDLRNNVIYNWGGYGCYGGEAMNVNIIGNYYKPGPHTATRGEEIERQIVRIGVRTDAYTKHNTDKPNKWEPTWHKWGTFFVLGNVNSKYKDIELDNWYRGVMPNIDPKNDGTFCDSVARKMRLHEPIPVPPTTTQPARVAYERVLEFAGASLHRDALDSVMVDDTRRGKARFGKDGIIDTQNDCKEIGTPWPVLKSLPAPKDTDGDGMPDDWEKAHHLNPNDATDGAAITTDGYTNLEHYLNSLVATIATKELLP